LVLIADQLVRAGPPKVDEVLAVPVFITAVAAVWLISKLSGRKGPPLVRLLLVLHLLMLTAVWVLSLLEHPALKPAGLRAGVEAMIAVSAMACQFTLLQIGIPGAPSTAVMTGNMTNSVLSLLELLAPGEPIEKLDNGRPTRSLELIGCFFAGCLAGAAACSWIGEWAWSLPVALAGVALAISR
jgi:uncharacterized membrane protein YoaK (UPF0700 family)